jgi:hypothetical protein
MAKKIVTLDALMSALTANLATLKKAQASEKQALADAGANMESGFKAGLVTDKDDAAEAQSMLVTMGYTKAQANTICRLAGLRQRDERRDKGEKRSEMPMKELSKLVTLADGEPTVANLQALGAALVARFGEANATVISDAIMDTVAKRTEGDRKRIPAVEAA